MGRKEGSDVPGKEGRGVRCNSNQCTPYLNGKQYFFVLGTCTVAVHNGHCPLGNIHTIVIPTVCPSRCLTTASRTLGDQLPL